jgi:UDP-N-acetylglucosamine--N-acetylmuramyl-(pentapeptide) pyrophosphoryl-undecaprenol N-acetylglucosamine transferase
MTGNPLRGRFSAGNDIREEALAYYGFDSSMPVVLVVGGSLGTRTLNEMMKAWIKSLDGVAPVQVIWQTGKFYEREMQEFLAAHPTKNIWQGAFIERMDYAYAAANVVLSRSGACTVSELCLVAKPTIFVPSPNVSEDHQTKNAMALVAQGAAEIVRDNEAVERGMKEAVALALDEERLEMLAANIAKLAVSDSAERVVKVIDEELNRA